MRLNSSGQMTDKNLAQNYGTNKLPDVPKLDSDRIKPNGKNMCFLRGRSDSLDAKTQQAANTADSRGIAGRDART